MVSMRVNLIGAVLATTTVVLVASAQGAAGVTETSSPTVGASIAGSCAAGRVAVVAQPCGRYIVTLSGGKPAAVAARHAALFGVRVRFIYETSFHGYAAAIPLALLPTIRNDPAVAAIEPDSRIHSAAQETPTGVARAFAAANAKIAIDGRDDRVDADIAVLDTGIDRDHPDLNVVRRTDCTALTVASDPQEQPVGCLDDAGEDAVGHGTHVGGIAAALDNGIGVVGTAPGARLWAVKVLDNNGFGTESQLLAGIEWVTAHADSIDVANLSLGCRFCKSAALDAAIASSVAHGVVYVVAGGNDAADAADFSPANNPNVIAVSAVSDFDGEPGGRAAATCLSDEQDDTLASFSNFGATIDIAAPGACIRSTTPGGRYGVASGTSMASPHVAGAAALLASAGKPTDAAGVAALRARIITAGNGGWSDDSGDGLQEPLLDLGSTGVYAPTISAGPFNARPLAHFTQSCDADLRCVFDASGSYDRDGSIARYGWEIADREKASGKSKVDTAIGAVVSHKFRRSGTYAVRLSVTDDDGAVGKDAVPVTVGGKKPDRFARPSCWDPTDTKCEAWVATYDNPNGYGAGGGIDATAAVASSRDGSRVFVTGGSYDNLTKSTDAVTAAFDRAGRQLWAARYAGSGARLDGGADVGLGPDGRTVFVAVNVDGDLSGPRPVSDSLTLAYDAATGRQLWAARFGEPELLENVNSLSVSADGSRVFVAGTRELPDCETEVFSDFFWSCYAYLTIAYDGATGRQLWVQTFGLDERPLDFGWAMRASPDGRRVFVTGTSLDHTTFETVTATVAYDAATGARLWTARSDTPAFDAMLALSADGSRVYVASAGDSSTTTAYDARAGARVWQVEQTSDGSFSPSAISASDGAVYLTGSEFAFGSGSFDADAVTVAYSALAGQKEWERRYEGFDSIDGSTFEGPVALQAAVDGVYVVGTAEAATRSGTDTLAIAYAADGAQRWIARYNPWPDLTSLGGAAATAAVLTEDRSRLYLGGFFIDEGDAANLARYAVLAYDTRAH